MFKSVLIFGIFERERLTIGAVSRINANVLLSFIFLINHNFITVIK